MKRNRSCVLVEDLLPSYLDGLTNDTTKEMIEEHLANCKLCQKYRDDLLVSNEQLDKEEQEKTRNFKRVMSKYRYQLLGLFLGMILTVVAVVGSITFGILWLRMAGQTDSSTQLVEEYRKFDEYYGISKLYLFPSASIKEDENVQINQYIYDCQGSKAYQTCQIYLECQYSKEAFEAEKNRLLNIKDRETGKSAVFTEEDFFDLGVYAMNNSDGCYEYALFFEEELKMVYVYLQGCVDRRDLLFSESYLPKRYGQNGYDYEMEVEGYSIYPKDEALFEEE